MGGAAGLRGGIVREYQEMGYDLAYSDLDAKLADLREFAKRIYAFLQKQEK